MSRLLLLAFAIFSLSTGMCQTSGKKTILFVCEHGAARSVIAAAYFNKIAKEKNLSFQAIFRGTDPQDSLTSGTKQGLKNDGFDVSKMKPQAVSAEDVKNAEQVITLDCSLPKNSNLANLLQWNGVPPISESYTIARDQISKSVMELIGQLQKKK